MGTGNPFDLTDEDCKAIGLVRVDDGEVLGSVTLFRGAQIHERQFGRDHIVWAEVDGRVFLGWADTRRAAFLAMLKAKPVDAGRKPVGFQLLDYFTIRDMVAAFPTSPPILS